MMWFRKALGGQSVQRQTTFRPRLESLEDRVTPSIAVTTSLLSGAVADVPVATTSGQIQMEAPPVAIPIVHGASGLGWGSLYTGITIKGQALDASGARLIQVGYAQDPMSSDIDLFVGYTLLSDGSGSGTLFNFAGMNTKGAGVDVDATGIIYTAGTQGSQGFMMRVENDLATVDWAATAGLNLPSAKLDTAGTNLYVGGADVGAHSSDVLVVKLNDLANPAGPHQVYYDIRSSGAGTSKVNGITVDANGRADLATSTIFENMGRTTYSPGFNQVEPDGTNKPGWGFLVSGDMNGVALAPDGTWITVGNYKADGDAVQSTTAVRMVNNIQGLDFNADTQWGWIFTFAADASANSVAIDSNGDYYYGGSLANAPDPTNMLYIKNSGVDGATQLDGFTIIFGPGQTGVVYAITLDGLGNAYVAGTLDADGVIVQVTGI
jgi:hypothetical protein